MQSRSKRVFVSVGVASCISAAAVMATTVAWVGMELHATAVTLPPGTQMGWDPVSFSLSERTPLIALAGVVFAASFVAMYNRIASGKRSNTSPSRS
jgi:hypothetical protein